jgi:hypothetical protein
MGKEDSMNWFTFDDYIHRYMNQNDEEWTILFEKSRTSNAEFENDIFGFCALLNNDEKLLHDYLQDFEWGFETTSFGNSYYQQTASNINGEFVDKISFIEGDKKDEFDYLVAYRSYNKKYEPQIEVNPKLIWYGNLVKAGNEYLDPVTDECMIKITNSQVQVLTSYLKDFLCSYHKACVIVFDHRRFGLVTESIKRIQRPVIGEKSYILYTFNDYSYKDFNAYVNIIGKSIITPYTKSRHSSLKYFEEKEYEEFIIGVDEKTGDETVYTCNEDELANFFGANPEAPHFLTPVYFNKVVLNKYKTDTKNYIISDGHISYLDEWIIPFTVNKDDKVIVWLGDLGRIPYEEQIHWKTENVPPKGGMEKNFIDQQMNNIFVEKILPEKWLFRLIKQANEKILRKYDECIFNELSDADATIKSSFLIPVKNNIDEYKEFLIQFCKITVETINKNLIKQNVTDSSKLLNDKGEQLASIAQLSVFFEEKSLKYGMKLIEAIKLLYNSRNKLAGHSASINEYNKLFKRDKNFNPNWILDAKYILNSINDALLELIEEI